MCVLNDVGLAIKNAKKIIHVFESNFVRTQTAVGGVGAAKGAVGACGVGALSHDKLGIVASANHGVVACRRGQDINEGANGCCLDVGCR